MEEVAIIGVGMHPFGRFENKTYVDIGLEATNMAIKDAGIRWKDIQTVYCGNVRLPITAGHNICKQIGLSRIPIVNVEAACASGGAAIKLACQAIVAGEVEIVLALGVEKSGRGFVDSTQYSEEWQNLMGLNIGPMWWAMWATRHMAEYGLTKEHIARVAYKNHKNSVNNPYAMYQEQFTMDEIINARLVVDPITLLEICAPNEGAAAAIVCSKQKAAQIGKKPIFIKSCILTTAGYPLTDRMPVYSISTKVPCETETTWAARKAYEESGIGPEDLSLVELQDTCASSELQYYEELGLCGIGEAGKLIDTGITEMSGKLPVSVSGGLISKGEPQGASHLGQVAEIVWQLRGQAGKRQVKGARAGLAHVVGANNNCCVTIFAN